MRLYNPVGYLERQGVHEIKHYYFQQNSPDPHSRAASVTVRNSRQTIQRELSRGQEPKYQQSEAPEGKLAEAAAAASTSAASAYRWSSSSVLPYSLRTDHESAATDRSSSDAISRPPPPVPLQGGAAPAGPAKAGGSWGRGGVPCGSSGSSGVSLIPAMVGIGRRRGREIAARAARTRRRLRREEAQERERARRGRGFWTADARTRFEFGSSLRW